MLNEGEQTPQERGVFTPARRGGLSLMGDVGEIFRFLQETEETERRSLERGATQQWNYGRSLPGQ